MLDFINEQDVCAEQIDSLHILLIIHEFNCRDVLNKTNQLLNYEDIDSKCYQIKNTPLFIFSVCQSVGVWKEGND